MPDTAVGRLCPEHCIWQCLVPLISSTMPKQVAGQSITAKAVFRPECPSCHCFWQGKLVTIKIDNVFINQPSVPIRGWEWMDWERCIWVTYKFNPAQIIIIFCVQKMQLLVQIIILTFALR
jgi:hypothetical protein